jgi:hypothetical protein
MCVESADLPDGVGVDSIEVDPETAIDENNGVVTVSGRLVQLDDNRWPYQGNRTAQNNDVEVKVVLSPYHSWGNRGPSTMRVWMPV